MQAKQNCEMSSPSISTLLAASGNRVVCGHAQQREHQQNGTHGQRTGGIPLKESSQVRRYTVLDSQHIPVEGFKNNSNSVAVACPLCTS